MAFARPRVSAKTGTASRARTPVSAKQIEKKVEIIEKPEKIKPVKTPKVRTPKRSAPVTPKPSVRAKPKPKKKESLGSFHSEELFQAPEDEITVCAVSGLPCSGVPSLMMAGDQAGARDQYSVRATMSVKMSAQMQTQPIDRTTTPSQTIRSALRSGISCGTGGVPCAPPSAKLRRPCDTGEFPCGPEPCSTDPCKPPGWRDMPQTYLALDDVSCGTCGPPRKKGRPCDTGEGPCGPEPCSLDPCRGMEKKPRPCDVGQVCGPAPCSPDPCRGMNKKGRPCEMGLPCGPEPCTPDPCKGDSRRPPLPCEENLPCGPTPCAPTPCKDAPNVSRADIYRAEVSRAEVSRADVFKPKRAASSCQTCASKTGTGILKSYATGGADTPSRSQIPSTTAITCGPEPCKPRPCKAEETYKPTPKPKVIDDDLITCGPEPCAAEPCKATDSPPRHRRQMESRKPDEIITCGPDPCSAEVSKFGGMPHWLRNPDIGLIDERYLPPKRNDLIITCGPIPCSAENKPNNAWREQLESPSMNQSPWRREESRGRTSESVGADINRYDSRREQLSPSAIQPRRREESRRDLESPSMNQSRRRDSSRLKTGFAEPVADVNQYDSPPKLFSMEKDVFGSESAGRQVEGRDGTCEVGKPCGPTPCSKDVCAGAARRMRQKQTFVRAPQKGQGMDVTEFQMPANESWGDNTRGKLNMREMYKTQRGEYDMRTPSGQTVPMIIENKLFEKEVDGKYAQMNKQTDQRTCGTRPCSPPPKSQACSATNDAFIEPMSASQQLKIRSIESRGRFTSGEDTCQSNVSGMDRYVGEKPYVELLGYPIRSSQIGRGQEHIQRRAVNTPMMESPTGLIKSRQEFVLERFTEVGPDGTTVDSRLTRTQQNEQGVSDQIEVIKSENFCAGIQPQPHMLGKREPPLQPLFGPRLERGPYGGSVTGRNSLTTKGQQARCSTLSNVTQTEQRFKRLSDTPNAGSQVMQSGLSCIPSCEHREYLEAKMSQIVDRKRAQTAASALRPDRQSQLFNDNLFYDDGRDERQRRSRTRAPRVQYHIPSMTSREDTQSRSRYMSEPPPVGYPSMSRQSNQMDGRRSSKMKYCYCDDDNPIPMDCKCDDGHICSRATLKKNPQVSITYTAQESQTGRTLGTCTRGGNCTQMRTARLPARGNPNLPDTELFHAKTPRFSQSRAGSSPPPCGKNNVQFNERVGFYASRNHIESFEIDIDKVQKMVDEENQDIEYTIDLIDLPQSRSPSSYSIRKKLKALRKKSRSVKILEESLDQNLPHDDEGSEVRADLVAILMHQEESGQPVRSPPRSKRSYYKLMQKEILPGEEEEFPILVDLSLSQPQMESTTVYKSTQRLSAQITKEKSPVGSIKKGGSSVAFEKTEVTTEEAKRSPRTSDNKIRSDMSVQTPKQTKAPSETKATGTPKASVMSTKPGDPQEDLQTEFPPLSGDEEEVAEAKLASKSPSVRSAAKSPSVRSATKGTSEESMVSATAVDYIMESEPPKHFSRVQLRGSTLPPWFPGYFSSLPGARKPFKVVKRPSIVMKNAWNSFKPTEVIKNSEIVIV